MFNNFDINELILKKEIKKAKEINKQILKISNEFINMIKHNTEKKRKIYSYEKIITYDNNTLSYMQNKIKNYISKKINAYIEIHIITQKKFPMPFFYCFMLEYIYKS